MVARRQISSKLSVAVIDWLVAERGMSQERIAEILEVTPGFVSRVRGQERGLTTEHLEQLADAVGVPLGAMLLATMSNRTTDPKHAELRKLAEAVLLQSDKATAAIRESRAGRAVTRP